LTELGGGKLISQGQRQQQVAEAKRLSRMTPLLLSVPFPREAKTFLEVNGAAEISAKVDSALVQLLVSKTADGFCRQLTFNPPIFRVLGTKNLSFCL
jgi:hypothetical protein